LLKMPSPIGLETLEHIEAAHPNQVPELEQVDSKRKPEQVDSKRKRPPILHSRHHSVRHLMSRTPWREVRVALVNRHHPVEIAVNPPQIESPSVSNR